MSSSDSSDSDERIRFKTESVRKISPTRSYDSYKTLEKLRENAERRRSSSCERYRREYEGKYSTKERSFSRKSRSPSHKSKRKHYSSSTNSSEERSRRHAYIISQTHSSKKQKYHNTITNEMSSKLEQIGPALPPHLQKKSKKEETEQVQIGPVLPPNFKKNADEQLQATITSPSTHNNDNIEENDVMKEQKNKTSTRDLKDDDRQIGPVLPSYLKKNTTIKETIVGPTLPPHLQKPSEKPDIIGPALPPNFRPKSPNGEENVIGPTLPPHLQQTFPSSQEDSDEDDFIGPLPSNSGSLTKAQILLEERALEMKLGELNPKTIDTNVREEWMLELPQAQAANLGLGPRQFRKNAAPDMSDRSSWTDTPAEKEAKKKGTGSSNKKIDLKREAEMAEIKRKDREQEKLIEKMKKKNRNKSLVDMHTDKMKKKNKESGISNERKPFNRETDLQVNRFDEAQKKAVLKKAQLLDSRFSAGESKFL